MTNPAQPSKVEKLKSLAKKHQTIVACVVTGSAAVAATLFVTISDKELAKQLKDANSDFAKMTHAYLDSLEFIDHKNMQDEYIEFLKQTKAIS